MIKKLAKEVLIWIWILNGHFGRYFTIDIKQKVIVIIPSYSIERVKHVEPQVRSLLKCDFVAKIIVSNHNPELLIEDWVKIKDARLTLINQPTRRGCGYGWIVASKANPEFLISIDDDLLIFPAQLAKLFTQLVEQPEVPHGYAGRLNSKYYQNKEMEVDNLLQIYAVTGTHLRKYLELVEAITSHNYSSYESIEFWADDILISQTGTKKPIIHNLGFLLRCPTANEPGVATYKNEEFQQRRIEVQTTLEKVKLT
jgi:hypothetical protein